MPHFVFTRYAQKRFQKLDKEVQRRVQRKLEQLREHEYFPALLKQLQDVDEVSYRLRVGNYRILLEKGNDEQYHIPDVGHRSEIYK